MSTMMNWSSIRVSYIPIMENEGKDDADSKIDFLVRLTMSTKNNAMLLEEIESVIPLKLSCAWHSKL